MCQIGNLNSQSSWLHFPGAEITDMCHQHWLIHHNLNLMGEIVQGVAPGPVQGFGLLLSFVPLILTVCSSRPKKQNASQLFTSSSLKLLLNSRGLRSLRWMFQEEISSSSHRLCLFSSVSWNGWKTCRGSFLRLFIMSINLVSNNLS